MEPLAPLAVTIAGFLCATLVMLAIALFRQLSKAVTELTRAVAVLQTVLVGEQGAPGLVDRVQSLHDWRNRMQERELDELRERNEFLSRVRGQGGQG